MQVIVIGNIFEDEDVLAMETAIAKADAVQKARRAERRKADVAAKARKKETRSIRVDRELSHKARKEFCESGYRYYQWEARRCTDGMKAWRNRHNVFELEEEDA